MRSLTETKSRWEETLKHSSSFAELQRAVKFNGPSSPCLAGCRSVCWKAFLLFHDAGATDWSHILLESRNSYSTLRDHYLKYIKHPEQLAELSVDPLSDDPDSPWIASRKDELVRAEILQDVQRLPDEPFYHQERIQTMILDILFVYCKLYPEIGGYRQGMHELLAPLVYVVDQDCTDRAGTAPDDLIDPIMVEMLDSYFVEHDAFALFSKLMDRAKDFYQITEFPQVGNTLSGPGEKSAIVDKSRQIHEICLKRIDPDLSNHLKNIEILPQIFLIRWIRLLFGREFPFEQLLVLWDSIFAFDPSIELIDLVCVAMLIRIRWLLLEADYSMALQLLLKYPAPQGAHGPHTFVDDAIYLRDHFNAAGGSTLIMKYTGKAPAWSASEERPTTPTRQFQGLSLRQRTLGAKSPLSPARFVQQQASVEALFQGAAKGVIERGERLGINQAVRDAMGEIRRNMQGLQDVRSSVQSGRGGADVFTSNVAGPSSLPQQAPGPSAAELDRRNKQLAAVLEETVQSLKALAASGLGDDKLKAVEAIEIAAAKVQFVKIHLEDSSMDLPTGEEAQHRRVSSSPDSLGIILNTNFASPTVSLDTTVVTTTTITPGPGPITDPLAGAPISAPSSAVFLPTSPDQDMKQTMVSPIPEHPLESDDLMDTDPSRAGEADSAQKKESTDQLQRPAAIPTRSTLAQSSFSWMLEPDMTPPLPKPGITTAWTIPPSSSSASSTPASGGGGGGTSSSHRKGSLGGGAASRTQSSGSRERNAFLFGEVTASGLGFAGPARGAVGDPARRPITSDEIFGLEPIRKPKAR